MEFTDYLAPSPFVSRNHFNLNGSKDYSVEADVEADIQDAQKSLRVHLGDENRHSPSKLAGNARKDGSLGSGSSLQVLRDYNGPRSPSRRVIHFSEGQSPGRPSVPEDRFPKEDDGDPAALFAADADDFVLRASVHDPCVTPEKASRQAIERSKAKILQSAGQLSPSIERIMDKETPEVSRSPTAAGQEFHDNDEEWSGVKKARMKLDEELTHARELMQTTAKKKKAGSVRAFSPPRTAANGAYSEAFVQELQVRYQDQIEEAQLAAQRLVLSKDEEMMELLKKVRQLQHHTRDEEDDHQSEVESLRRENMLLALEIENAVHKERLAQKDEMKKMEARHQVEINKLLEEREQEMQAVRARCQDQVEEVKATQQGVFETIQAAKADEEYRLRAKLSEVESQRRDEALELHKQLNAESERLSSARGEITQLKEMRRHDLVVLRAKLEECVGILDSKTAEYEMILQRKEEAHQLKEMELRDIAATAEENLQLERNRLEEHKQAIDDRMRRMERVMRDMEARHHDQLTGQAHNVVELQESYKRNKEAAQQARAESQQLLNVVRQLKQENNVLVNEMRLLDTETSRLREENAKNHVEIERLNTFIYGKEKKGKKPHPPTREESGRMKRQDTSTYTRTFGGGGR